MIEKFKNKFRIDSARLRSWDYGWNAAYFITMCTKHHLHNFGEIVDGMMGLSEIGCLAWQFWYEIPEHFAFVNLDAFIVMPNHVHAIIVIDKPDGGLTMESVETGHCPVSTAPAILRKSPGQLRFPNQGQNTISSVVGSYKSVVSKHAHKINALFAWQTRFYDHIICDEKSYNRIYDYILDNPRRWHEDRYYS